MVSRRPAHISRGDDQGVLGRQPSRILWGACVSIEVQAMRSGKTICVGEPAISGKAPRSMVGDFGMPDPAQLLLVDDPPYEGRVRCLPRGSRCQEQTDDSNRARHQDPDGCFVYAICYRPTWVLGVPGPT